MTGGHVGEVRDVDWHESFLMSVGQDQTTRAFAKSEKQQVYLEIARPQVHGHDMQCLSFVNPSVFVSGAEEKVFRAFRAPKSFVKSLESITGIPAEKSFGTSQLAEFGACVPALGLSNKPMVEGETVDGEHWEEDAFRAAPTILTGNSGGNSAGKCKDPIIFLIIFFQLLPLKTPSNRTRFGRKNTSYMGMDMRFMQLQPTPLERFWLLLASRVTRSTL